MTYLDHNASSPLRPEAQAAMERALSIAGNPSSVHQEGRLARALVEDARERVAALVGARPQDVIFTSGGTEANALGLWGAVQGAADAQSRLTRLFVSAIEHDSVLKTAGAIGERQAGIRTAAIAVTRNGTIDINALRAQFREGKGRAMLAVMAANNETGVIQPTASVAELAKEHGALLLMDAVQACGKIAVDGALADYVSLSAHKIGGPKGVGALILRETAPLVAQILGGGQERGRRAGTENVVGIAGFGAAADAVRSEDIAPVAALRDSFEMELKARIPGTVVFGSGAARLPNMSCFAVPGVAAETAVMALDLDGIKVSAGAACSSGKVRPSHVLEAMGVSDELAGCALRASFGWNSAAADVDAALASLEKLTQRAAARRAA
jgi:cysteine desulfurase